MYNSKSNIALILIYNFIIATLANKVCNKTECTGPIKYYEELKCKAVFKNPDDCCPSSYNCQHLDTRSKNKCYVNNNEYEIGDRLKSPDEGNCDRGCRCIENQFGIASFRCTIVDCFPSFQPNCYQDYSKSKCCGKQVCDAEYNDITCNVEGKSYKKGERFYPANTDLSCICLNGYTGENVEPFCKTVSCGFEVHNGDKVHKKCSPIFYSGQDPTTSCAYAYKCAESQDYIVKTNETREDLSDEPTCKLGNFVMQIGDELRSRGEDYSNKCLRCKCETPPLPTCKYLPDDICGFKPPFVPTE